MILDFQQNRLLRRAFKACSWSCTFVARNIYLAASQSSALNQPGSLIVDIEMASTDKMGLSEPLSNPEDAKVE